MDIEITLHDKDYTIEIDTLIDSGDLAWTITGALWVLDDGREVIISEPFFEILGTQYWDQINEKILQEIMEG
jgi:hypothetical protein